jgi:flagellar biosynthetic protein FliO
MLSLAGIILVLFLTYYGTRWLSVKTNLTMKSRYMNIVDKIMLGQNKFLAIAEVNNKFYLLSITEKNINILKELEDFQLLPDENPENNMDFNKIINKFLKNK